MEFVDLLCGLQLDPCLLEIGAKIALDVSGLDPLRGGNSNNIGLHIPDRRNEADALIAATALVHGLAVVTRNIQDFDDTGVIVIDPWQD